MRLITWIICSSIIASPAFGLTCSKVTYHFYSDGKRSAGEEIICSKENLSQLSSPSCKNPKEAACGIGKKALHFSGKEKIPRGMVGNPFFLLCHKIGGVPQEIEIKEEKISRCLDLSDKSFIDLETMMKLLGLAN